MSNIPFLNNAYFTKDVGIGGEFTPNARLDIRDATNNNLRIGTRGGTMDLFSVNNAGAAAPLNFEASEFNFLTGDVNFNNSIAVDKLVVIDSLNNSFIGEDSGKLNTTGFNNTAFGTNSLENNTTGSTNTAIGFNALFFNTTGENNVALGFNAGISNTTGDKNIAIGVSAMGALDGSRNEGDQNIAIGATALPRNTTGVFNIALGAGAMSQNNTGQRNIGIGVDALDSNTTGSDNTGLGAGALQKNQTGSDNIAIGAEAGEFYYFNNGGGVSQGNNTTPEKSIFIGSGTEPNSNGETNQIVIGDSAVGNGTNTVTLGNDNVTDTRLKGNVQTNGSVSATDNIYLNSSTNSNITFQESGATKWIAGYVPFISAFRFSNGSSDVLTLKNDQSATFASSVTSKNITIQGASGGYTTGDNPMIGLGNAPVSGDFGTIEMPFGDKMKLNAYHGYNFKVSNSGSSAVDALTINIDRSATFASSVTAGNSSTVTNSSLELIGYSSTTKSHIGQFSNALYLSSNYFYNGNQNNDDNTRGQAGIILSSGSSNTSFITFNLSDAGSTSPTTKLTIASSGAATFASSVSAVGNFNLTGTTRQNIILSQVNGGGDGYINSGYSGVGAIANIKIGIKNIDALVLESSTGAATFASSVQLAGALRITETGSAQRILIGNQDSAGANKPSIIQGVNGAIQLGYGNSWNGEGGTFTSSLSLNDDRSATFASSAAVGNNSAAASASNAGSIRYRVSGNNSYVDMSMRTGASSYMWVNIVQNNW